MSWDQAYSDYSKRLTTGEMDEAYFRNLYDQVSKEFSDNVVNIFNELKQQRQYTDNSWYGGKVGKENITWDMAFRLAESGVGSVYDVGQRQVERDVTDEGGTWKQVDQELFNKKTGEALTKFNEIRESSRFDTRYNINFMPDGTPVAYTSNRPSDWVSFRDEVLKPALPIALMAFPGIGQAIGTALTPVGTSATVASMVGGAVVGGTMAELSGGSFIKGAVLGATGAGASQFAGNIGEMIGLQGKMAEQVGNAILQGARAELAGGDFLKGAAMSGLISTVSNATGYTEKDIKSVISAVKALDDPNVFKLAGAFSNLKNLDYFKEDKAAEIFEKIQTNNYDFKADYSLDLTAPSGSGLGLTAPPVQTNVFNEDGTVNYDVFDFEGFDVGTPALEMPTAPNLESMGGGQGILTDNNKPYVPDLGDPKSFINKPAPDVDNTKPQFSPSGALTGLVIASQLPKDKEPKPTIPTSGTGITDTTGVPKGDIYRDAPIKGFAMRKYKNAAGQEKYIPFIGESPQLRIPEGFTPAMNKGGFIKRRS